jgi:hypothetical protein
MNSWVVIIFVIAECPLEDDEEGKSGICTKNHKEYIVH